MAAKKDYDIGECVTLKTPWKNEVGLPGNEYTHGIVTGPSDMVRGKLIAINLHPFNPISGIIAVEDDGTPAVITSLLEEVEPFNSIAALRPAEQVAAADSTAPRKRGRGRPPKATTDDKAPKRGRGRPPKTITDDKAPKRGRGRPPKEKAADSGKKPATPAKKKPAAPAKKKPATPAKKKPAAPAKKKPATPAKKKPAAPAKKKPAAPAKDFSFNKPADQRVREAATSGGDNNKPTDQRMREAATTGQSGDKGLSTT